MKAIPTTRGFSVVGVALPLLLAAAGAVGAEERVMIDDIAALALELEPQLVETRRWFHQHPELSNREVETGREIARRLRGMGYEPRTGVAGNGVVAVLEGALPGPVVAWRSDIDALPIEEEVEVPYRSANPGVMHACGHDLHTAVGLGAADILMRLKDRLHGTVVFIFQPAEEGPPEGEEGGATLMIAEGVLEKPPVEAIFGMHVMPTFEAGQVGVRAGGLMAAGDQFTLTVRGRMSHGSAPHEGVDAVYVGAQVVSALQAIASREVDARRSLVVSVGSFHAGNRWNIIADEAVLVGTVRTLDSETWSSLPERFERVVKGICDANRASYELRYERIAPPVENHPRLAAFAKESLVESLGPRHVVETDPIMASEDFAYFQQRVPGVFLFLGVGNRAEGWTDYVHTPGFRPDERAIRFGTVAAASLLADFTASDPLDR
ncbi:MAG: M20 family metallopeptidase [Thermoanaerobaculales bacterium]|jgi:amidohydrolase|nr:M20 family metallopeptidase [Thermoanaerobaculales bacterium]